VDQARRLKELEQENTTLKRLVAELSTRTAKKNNVLYIEFLRFDANQYRPH
jgi:hypothetical protein